MNKIKLVADLIIANQAACEAVVLIDDGGSANLDSVFLRIPRAKEVDVLDAIREAGLYCRGKRKWIGNGYMVKPTCSGQGNKRTKGVEAMATSLKANGWDALIFRQMD